jgi:hypothetical protein
MIKKQLYRYYGKNGILTTPILLEGIPNIPLIELVASKGHTLTNGVQINKVIITDEENLSKWYEIADNNDE